MSKDCPDLPLQFPELLFDFFCNSFGSRCLALPGLFATVFANFSMCVYEEEFPVQRIFIVFGVLMPVSHYSRARILFLASSLVVAAAAGCSGGHINSASPSTQANTPKSLVSIAVTPASPGITVSGTEQFTATGTYSDGTTANVTSSAAWSSSNTAIVTVSTSGLATGIAAGSATVAALLNGVSGSTGITVSAAAVTMTALSLSPASASATAGATQQFTASATYSNGSTATPTSGVSWSSSNTAVATVNSSGLAKAIAAGTATITATAGNLTAQATLAVVAAAKTVSSIAVAPVTATVTTGETQQFAATATYSDGSTAAVTSTATWSSSDTNEATVNSGGLAKGVGAGVATITATLDGVSGSAALTVQAAAVTSIAVTPANASFDAGSTEQFTATAQYNNGSTANVTSSATWSSSDTSVATISATGLASGVAQGTTTVTAALNGQSASVTVTVTPAPPAANDVNITTWHVDTNRSGLNANEQTLTPANVTASGFGKLFSYLVDGYVYGSPLIMSNVKINGASHDVIYVATENDSVYAFDADSYGSGAPLWQVSLLNSGETPITDGPIQPVEGVTSTPVIDPNTGTLYVVSAQKSSSGSSFRLNALDITTGAQKFGGPVTINASVAATNSDSVNGVQTLNTSCIQRAALLLANGNVYAGFGSCHSGWLVAYSASNLGQMGVFNASPNLNGEGEYASAGGVWMGGAGPVADSSGNVYITTGNGPWDGQTAFGDSVLRFGPTPVSGSNGTMQPVDYFTPSIYQFMDCNDADLAAGGLLLVPGSTTLIAGGKTGTLYLVDSTNLGHESANDDGAIQEQVWGQGLTDGGTYQSSCQDSTGVNYANITSYEIFGTSAYFNGNVYLGVTPTSSSAPGGVRQFSYSGTLSPDDDTSNYQQQGTRGTSPFISANGTSNGIVWMIDQGNPLQNSSGAAPTAATLRAYDAGNFPNEIYDSSTNAGDTPGYGIKFSSPVVANGKVYISTGHDLTTVSNPQGEIDVYGLK